MFRRTVSWITILILVPFVFGAHRDGNPSVNMNMLQEMIRSEISDGLEKQVKVYLDEMKEAEQQRGNSQFSELLQDLKETVNLYEQSAKTSNAPVVMSLHRPAMLTQSNVVQNITNMVEKLYRKEKNNEAHNCADLQMAGKNISGVYSIRPKGSSPIKVYCDFTTHGGGWTVFQSRHHGEVNFYRDWLEYVNGFGDVTSEHWLGLRHIHTLTHTDLMELYIHLEDHENNQREAMYDFFAVSSEYTDFRLDIGSYHGDAGDGMAHSRGHRFSTKDKDNDNHPNDHCAVRFTGGWWYNSCYRANLNGQYGANSNKGITWNHWRGDTYSMKATSMMLRPVGFIPP